MLTSGNSGLLAIGSASFYSLTLLTAAVVLALLVLMSPEPFDLPSRPALAGARRAKRSRIRRRLDAMLIQMLSDDSDEAPRRPDGPSDAAAPRGDRSRHRLPRPARRRPRRKARRTG